ncbi:MAG TPA: hypothetical protein VJ201_00680, partial [Candidatus Babeliales bacterium]|nr:hypothetical protein [Candidatus Babeliales bacterium]
LFSSKLYAHKLLNNWLFPSISSEKDYMVKNCTGFRANCTITILFFLSVNALYFEKLLQISANYFGHFLENIE